VDNTGIGENGDVKEYNRIINDGMASFDEDNAAEINRLKLDPKVNTALDALAQLKKDTGADPIGGLDATYKETFGLIENLYGDREGKAPTQEIELDRRVSLAIVGGGRPAYPGKTC